MSKELEALKRIETTFSMNKQGKESVYRKYMYNIYPYYEDFNLVLNALQRLEAIDNANPSEALEKLNIIEENLTYELRKLSKIGNQKLAIETATGLADKFEEAIKPIKQALIKAREQEKENKFLSDTIATVNKQYTDLMLEYQEQEKVLEIITEKNVNIASLKAYDLEEYNMIYENKLTEEEFDLLKRWQNE